MQALRGFSYLQHWTKKYTGEPNTLRHDGVYIARPYQISRLLLGSALRNRWPAAFEEEIVQRFTQQLLDTGVFGKRNLAQLSGHGRIKVTGNCFLALPARRLQ